MTYEEIIKELKNKIYRPVYFLMGEESYYIDKITEYIMNNVLTDAEKSFNQTVVYGKDVDLGAVLNHAKRFPMMANYQVVIVKEAQQIKGLDASTKEDKNPLQLYLEKPLKSTILVFNYKHKKLDKRKKIYNVIKKNALVFESDKLYENKIPQWINAYLKEKKYSITPEGAQLLTDFLGNDLSKITNELDKLQVMLDTPQLITPTHIEENIGISKEYNIFELIKALAEKDAAKSFRIANFFGLNHSNYPIQIIIGTLFTYFAKLLALAVPQRNFNIKDNRSVAAELKISPYFVDEYKRTATRFGAAKLMQIVGVIRDYDLKSKGVGAPSMPPGELLKEMVFKIMY